MKLVTHNARFHYDELLASAFLRTIYPESTIIRTRDESIIAQGDIVYDVGSVFNPETCRFDHHQHTFTETYSPDYKYKLSSAGLIYKYYQRQYFAKYNISHEDPLYDKLVEKVYKEFVLGADCVDNGIDIYGEVKPRTIYAMVDCYNEYKDLMSEKQNENFFKALELVSKDLEMYISSLLESWFYKYKDLETLIRQNYDYILVADEHYGCDLILEIEKKYGKNIFYLIFPSDGKYKIRAINVDNINFSLKLPLLNKWRGKREEELKDIEGAEFVHASGFIGINKTKEGAIKMCRMTYENQE